MAANDKTVRVEGPDAPVGRLVGGSIYEGKSTNMQGQPLVYKTGPNAGQPRKEFFFSVAIPKKGEQHWSQTTWGQKVLNVGAAAFPQFYQLPQFAWKIEDGDDATPNPQRNGRRNCDTEGYKGCWILKLKGSTAPKVYRQENGGYVQVLEPNFVKPGYWVMVPFSIEPNDNAQKPGVYINHGMILFVGYGQEIVFGPDAATAFGNGPAALPVGASATPMAGAMPMPAMPGAPAAVPQMPPAMPGAPALPGAPAAFPGTPGPAYSAAPALPGANGLPQIPGAVPQMPGAPAPLAPAGSVPMPSAPAPAAAAPIPVMPNPGFVQVPPPAAAPAPVARQMTAAAQGVPYDQWIAKGWTDATLVQHGYMLA